jgi:hypothetical protein
MTSDINEAVNKLMSFPPCRALFEDDDAAWITDILEESKGVDPMGVTVYRVYYAAAEALKLVGSVNRIKQKTSYLEGSLDYFDPKVNIESYLQMQAKQDAALALTIPEVYKINTIGASFVAGPHQWEIDSTKVRSQSPQDLEDRYFTRTGRNVGGLRR